MFQQLPTAGLPFQFTTWAEFEAFVGDAVTTGVIEELTEVRWDVRPAPHLGTLENRVCDGVSTFADLSALVALMHCLVVDLDTRLAAGEELPTMPPWHVQENKWRAARYGLDAIIILDADSNEGLITDDLPSCSGGWRRWPSGSAARPSWRRCSTSRRAGRRTSGSGRSPPRTDGDLVAVVDSVVQELRVGARMTIELSPLTVDHAPAMVSVLADPSLYEFTGGTPPTLEELTARYARQTVGHSPDGSEQWLNWVVLLDSVPVGYVQATVVGDSAEIAWVISPSVQGRGVATEAARAMGELLTAAGVRRLVAHVHPDHIGLGAGLRAARPAAYRRDRGRRGPLGPRRPVVVSFAEWQAWRDAREERLRDPHGWLAITAIHWLTPAPQRFDDVPGEWSGDERRATVTLAPGETLGLEGGATLAEGVHVFGPLDDVGLRLAFGDAVAQVAERDGRLVVRPRHPDSPNRRAYRGTPCYPADPAWVLPGRFEPYAAARRAEATRR